MQNEAAAAAAAATAAGYWRRLLHRWFVEYNPLYLVSATLVLGGMILSSRGLAREGSLYGEIGVAAIAEIYSIALIGGAAILMRLQHRRSAVMLALLTVLYQCDLTLHTETCPNLGGIGIAATFGWLLLFVGKLVALGWAMRLRFSRGMLATTSLGGVGLALLPYAIQRLEPRTSSAMVAIWLFALVALQKHSLVTSKEELTTDWGHTVLRRSTRATWTLWGGLTTLHVLFWSWQYHLDLATTVLPIAPLVMTRFVRRETRVWALVLATLVMTALRMEASFSITALLASVALGLRAWLVWKTPAESELLSHSIDAPVGPYRLPPDDEPDAHTPANATRTTIALPPVIPTGRAALHRLMVGAVLTLYLSLWTLGWSGGAWPAHILALDLGLALVLAVGAWRLRARIALLPLSIGAVEVVIASHIIPSPRSLVEWGGSAIGLGFVLLIVSIAVSYYLRKTGDPNSAHNTS